MIIRDIPCEKKFDNSIIRDKEKTVIFRGTPCEKEKFDNSIIRDKEKPVIIRDIPCEKEKESGPRSTLIQYV